MAADPEGFGAPRSIAAHAAKRAGALRCSQGRSAGRVAGFSAAVGGAAAASPYRLLRDSLRRHRGLHPHPLGLRLRDVVLDHQVAQRLVEILEALTVYPIMPGSFFEQV